MRSADWSGTHASVSSASLMCVAGGFCDRETDTIIRVNRPENAEKGDIGVPGQKKA